MWPLDSKRERINTRVEEFLDPDNHKLDENGEAAKKRDVRRWEEECMAVQSGRKFKEESVRVDAPITGLLPGWWLSK